MRRAFPYAVIILMAAAAAAQPTFAPDDFLGPGQHAGPVFASRLTVGGASGLSDHYRPLGQGVVFLHLANSAYWSRFQFDYDHTEVRGNDNGPARVQACSCSPPIYFPTPPPPNATPNAPLPSSTDTVQFGWYHPLTARGAQTPIMLRYQVMYSRQSVDTIVSSGETGQAISRSGYEQSFGVNADTYFRLGGHALFGSLTYARTTQSGTTANRTQNELTYTNKFPALPVGKVLVRAMLTVGSVTGRGASGLNVVNPAFETFWHHWGTRANLHLVWSPLSIRDGAEGWRTNHQIVLSVDRALFVKERRAH